MGMATRLTVLRRLHRLHRHRSLLPPHFLTAQNSNTFSSSIPSNPNPQLCYGYFSYRSFSWQSWTRESPAASPAAEGGSDDSSGESFESGSEFSTAVVSGRGAELSHLGLDGSGTAEEVVGEAVWDYPVNIVISLLDGYHDLTGLPWWAIIATSTFFMRATLLAVLIFQLKKAGEIAALFPKLPPPFPPPLSGRSYREQYLLFQKKKQELGCPSFLWNFAFFTVQFPCFLLWMASIRRMCLDNHPGFDNGGTLWFQNLTDFPHGILGPTFPILIAGLHYVNIQISFQSIKFEQLQGILGLLAKYYKLYLDILSIPLLLIGFLIPQGSLVYWVTNSTLTSVQQLSLKNPYIRMKLGLPNVERPTRNKLLMKNVFPESLDALDDQIPVESLPPEKLFDLALEDLAAGNPDKALPLLRMATEKDPELVKAFIAMGQILCSKKIFVEAAEYFERAISKIQEKEDVLLVLAYFGAGVSHIWQGNKSEGIEHLKRIAELKEPDSPMDKACYYQGLVILGSTLFQEGEKSEAVKYLRLAAAYDPAVIAYVKECEEG